MAEDLYETYVSGARRVGRLDTDCLDGRQISDIVCFALDHLENHGLPLNFFLPQSISRFIWDQFVPFLIFVLELPFLEIEQVFFRV